MATYSLWAKPSQITGPRIILPFGSLGQFLTHPLLLPFLDSILVKGALSSADSDCLSTLWLINLGETLVRGLGSQQQWGNKGPERVRRGGQWGSMLIPRTQMMTVLAEPLCSLPKRVTQP